MTAWGYSELMLGLVVVAALIASWHDFRRHRVPNALNAVVLLLAFAAQWICFGAAGLSAAFLGMIVAGGPLLVLWRLRMMGAGDVKYMAALGAWLGPTLALHALVLGALVGGLMAVAMILVRGSWRQSVNHVGLLALRLGDCRSLAETPRVGGFADTAGGVLPYAIPLSVGALGVVFGDYFGWWKVL